MNRIVAVHMSSDFRRAYTIEVTAAGKVIHSISDLDTVQKDNRMQLLWDDPKLTIPEKEQKAIALLKELFGKPPGAV